MNFEKSMRDIVVPFDARYGETEVCAIKEQRHPAEDVDAGTVPVRSCDTFEGGLGI